MNNQSILLIGNGPSILQYEMGETINSFPLVCRFNWFKIIEYERWVGTKCDIWVTCLEEPYIKLRCNSFKKIYFPLSQQKFIQMTKVFPNSKCFPPEIYNRASRINGDYFYPSSGLLATLFFLDLGYEVILHGFDFFQKKQHHYCDSQPMGENHSPNNELLAFRKLLDKQKVKMLNEYSNSN